MPRLSLGFVFISRPIAGGLWLSGLGAFDAGQLRRVDDDLAGLFLLRHDALQRDMQQAVLKPGAADFNMLGQLELTLKRAACDALMQEGRLGIGVAFALALHGQDTITDLDGEILFSETGHRDGDGIMILVAALDIVGRVALGIAVRLIQQIKQPIEADSGTEKRGMIQTHDNNLLEALRAARDIPRGFRCGFAPGTASR